MSSLRLLVRAVARIAALGCVGVILCLAGIQSSTAQSLGWFDSLSSLVWYPSVEGDAKARLMWVGIGEGSFSGTSLPGSVQEGGGLRGTFNLNKEEFFIDSMVRLQIGRFSARAAYEARDFVGFRAPGLGETRISYSGLRLGGDFDMLIWNRTRLGVDLDYDLYNPRFVYPSLVSGNPNAKFSGPNALTLGVHAICNPLRTIWGASPIVEARARWPIQGSQVKDWEISGGVASPATLMGSFSLTAGYRNTRLSYSAAEAITSVTPTSAVTTTNPRLETVFDGWFAEFAFYY
jgi:hypothetical protein